MVRRLIVMRHAKSSWSSPATDDHSRPLNKRGQQNAPQVATRLAELDWLPQAVLSSDSTRTRETIERMVPGWETEVDLRFLSSFYHAGVEEICAELNLLTDEIETVMVLGHNPGWQHAVYWFSGQSEPMTTANAALLEINAETWSIAADSRGRWRLVDVIRPKEL